MTGSEFTASDLAREMLAASRAEPGQPDAGVGGVLERSGVSASEADGLIASVRESQLLNARLRRRAAEVEALFSTARELVRLQDVDDVLKRLVERAHELMGTDVTYLSEVENEAGDLRVRHSAGTVTPEFRDLLVPAGFGLASKVASTREPAWVARYQAMQEAPHDRRIDAAVDAEGLVSFLGVPLAVGDEVLGALFACNRFGYEYTPEEILLLSAFADHAAAVLRTARALADRAAATTRAEEAYREVERHLAATERASAIHEELTSAVMSGATIADLVATVARRLGRKVWALNEDGRGLHRGGSLPSRRVLHEAMAASQASGHAESFEARGARWILVAILGADRVVGAIIAEGSGTGGTVDLDQRTLERAAHVAALVSLKREAATALRAERRARWLLKVIDGGDPDSASDDGVDASATISGCTVIDVRERDSAAAASTAAAAVGDDGFVAQRDRRLIIAWTVGDVEGESERVRRTLSNQLREPALTAVVCGHLAGAADLPGAVKRASADLDFLPALGIDAVTVSSDLFAPYHSLVSPRREAATRFVDDLLGGVLSWDERRGTALFETLTCFFDSGASRQAAAEKMHIHKNTVQQRLERVQALLDGDWDHPEFRFRVQAAVRLETLRRAVAGARRG